MAVKIRLQRTGRKNRPFYRIVIAEEGTKRSGKVISNLGFFDPMSKPERIKVNKKELERWISKGAQPTQSLRKLLSL